MEDRKLHQAKLAGVFQRTVRIEELESRQFLTTTGADVSEHVRHAQASAAQVSARTVAPAEKQDAAESSQKSSADDAAEQVRPTASASKSVQTQSVENETEFENESPSQSAAKAEETSARESQQTRSQPTGVNEGEGNVSSSNGSSAGTSEGATNSAASAGSESEVASTPIVLRETTLASDAANAANTALFDAPPSAGVFSSSVVTEELLGAVATQSAGNLPNPVSEISTSRAARLGDALVLATSAFSSKAGLQQLITALPQALANLGSGGAEAMEAGTTAAVNPFFYFPRINWANALSDAWDSFAQDSVALPLAEIGGGRARVITIAVGAADAVLLGYWIRSRQRRKRAVFARVLSGRPLETFE